MKYKNIFFTYIKKEFNNSIFDKITFAILNFSEFSELFIIISLFELNLSKLSLDIFSSINKSYNISF